MTQDAYFWVQSGGWQGNALPANPDRSPAGLIRRGGDIIFNARRRIGFARTQLIHAQEEEAYRPDYALSELVDCWRAMVQAVSEIEHGFGLVHLGLASLASMEARP